MISLISIVLYVCLVVVVVVFKINSIFEVILMHYSALPVLFFLAVSWLEMSSTDSLGSYNTARGVFLYMLFATFLLSTVIFTNFQIAKWDFQTYMKNEKQRVHEVIYGKIKMMKKEVA